MMRNAVVAMMAGALLVSGCALEARPEPDVLSLDRFGEKTKNTKQVYPNPAIEIRSAGTGAAVAA